MLFNSLIFVVFFIVVYGLYLLLEFRFQNIMLLVASYLFYGWWDWRFLFLIFISTIADYNISIWIQRCTHRASKRAWLTASVVINLGILFVFKYFGFFIESFADILSLVGMQPNLPVLQFVLPVGISFYTFQTLSYTIDVYRGQLQPIRNPLNFALFVAYFPQLVAGPIERATSLLPQIANPRKISRDQCDEGAWLILIGYYKKVVLADNLAPLVDQVFNTPSATHGMAIPAALLGFAFQIYGDFSGYSNIARGISKWLGIELMVNFRMPYFASSPSDFWRRWHISLSTWLRDYLYIPLGGNRRGSLKTYRNLALTMLLGGVWHGAAWHYVIWGAYHGMLLVIQKLVGVHGFRNRILGALCFFPLTLIGWLFFRVNELGDVVVLLKQTLYWSWSGKVLLLTIAVFAVPLVALEILQEKTNDMMAVKRLPRHIKLPLYSFLLFCIFACGATKNSAFIYFQF